MRPKCFSFSIPSIIDISLYTYINTQEVVKCTGKYQPLNQWLHLDCLEVLPSERPTDTAPRHTRYDDLVTIFGASFADKVSRRGRRRRR